MKINLNILSVYRTHLMGVSILLIVIFHSLWGMDSTSMLRFSRSFSIGVEYFLFLSGIGCYYSLSKNTNVRSFYKRRLLRIIPTYLIVALPYFLYLIPVEQWWKIIAKVSMLYTFKGDMTFWFIPCVLLCYTVAPYFYKCVDSRLAIIFSLLSFVPLGLIGCYLPKQEVWIDRIPIFLLGMSIAPYVANNKSFNISWAGVVIIAVVAILAQYFTTFFSIGVWTRVVHYVITMPVLLLLAMGVDKITQFKRHPNWSLLAWLGTMSLEIYLVHEHICLPITWHWITNPYFSMMVSLGLACLFAFLIHITVNYLLTRSWK